MVTTREETREGLGDLGEEVVGAVEDFQEESLGLDRASGCFAAWRSPLAPVSFFLP